jgi:transcription elongation factor Elf1
MGTFYHFECPVCGYDADVCGGDEVGIMITTSTIHCEDCRKLYDVFSTFR